MLFRAGSNPRCSWSNARFEPEIATYITAHGNARSLPQWARLGIKPPASWFLVGFVSAAPQWDLQYNIFLISLSCVCFLNVFIVVEVRNHYCECIFFFVFCHFRAAPTAHGGSQAKSQMGAVAADLHHSHSNEGSKPNLWPKPQLAVTPDS